MSKLTVGISTQCICISNYHMVYLKHMYICQLYLNKAQSFLKLKKK